MSKYLCTFPGKFGDILWSLPTAKYISEKIVNAPVDFAVMPYYESIVPLIQEQSYIDKAFVISDWLRTHSNYGDQPWEAPVKGPQFEIVVKLDEPYEKIWHLGYRCHPGRAFGNVELPLMDFVAWQQGITFNEPMIPFLSVKEVEKTLVQYVTIAFNEQYSEQKAEFKAAVQQELKGIPLIYLDAHPWLEALEILANDKCVAFVGDRSANWVIANGLGKQCITFEPHPSRHKSGHLGHVFGCPQGKEIALPFNMPPEVAAATAAAMVRKLVEEKHVVASA